MSRCIVFLSLLAVLGCSSNAPATKPATPNQPEPATADHGKAHTGNAHTHSHPNHHHGGPMVHRFERAEDWAPRFDAKDRDGWQKPAEVIALLELSPGMVVADIGAGTGYFMPHLARAVGPNGKVWALDVEPDMVRYLRARARKHKLDNVNARAVAADDPQLPPASVDRVLIVDTWHHLGKRVDYARKLRAGLRPNGKLIIVDFTLDAKRGPPRKHRLAPETILKELEAAGFKAKILTESLPDQYVIAATP